MRRLSLVVFGFMIATAACKREQPPIPASPPKPVAVAPIRGASGDSDLRVMLSELASARACSLVRGGFHGLRAPDHPDVVTGVLWIRGCEISNVGAHVDFHITGNGWLWVDKTTTKAGGTFVVRQYVRFTIDSKIRGGLDIAYDRDAHVVTLWFTPDTAPVVEFNTIGDVEVDRQGVWSSVVGALGSAFSSSPEDLALSEAESQGTHDLSAQLANGLAVTINLCTGLRRVHLGRPPKGDMGAADVGETRKVAVDLQPGGVMIIGPQAAEDGMTLRADALEGAVRLTLVCAKDAEKVASEYMAGEITSKIPVIGSVDVRTKAALAIKSTACPIVVVASPLDNARARFAWERPTAEIARSTGGPLIHCPAASKSKH